MNITQLDKPYTLSDIENGLRNPHYYYTSAQNGNLGAMDQLADARLALQLSNPTPTQMECLELVWQQEYTLREAGEILGVTTEAVFYNLQRLSTKLEKVVTRWAVREINGA